MAKGMIIDFMAFAAENETLLRELVELAARHGFEFALDELNEAQLDQASGGVDATASVEQVSLADSDFLALQNAFQVESRKYQTLAQASRARHDLAQSSIQNTRA